MDFVSKNYIDITYILCALLGGVMHWVKKYLTGETKSKIHQWFGPHNLAATFYTVTIFFFAIVGSLAADIINSSTTFWAAMYTGFVTGFAIDSGFNRDMRDVNHDLLETRDSMRELFDHSNIGSRGISPRGRGVADDDDDDDDQSSTTQSATSDDDGTQDSSQMTVEERRAKLRKKLGTE